MTLKQDARLSRLFQVFDLTDSTARCVRVRVGTKVPNSTGFGFGERAFGTAVAVLEPSSVALALALASLALVGLGRRRRP